MIESGVTLDFGQLVLDDEIARMIRHVLEGVQVRPETLLVRDILDVGWSGDFMSRDSTLLGMRTMSAPRLFDRGVYEAWDAAGRADPARRARDKALALLSEDDDDPLPADVAAELDAIVGRSDRVARVPRSETPPGTA